MHPVRRMVQSQENIRLKQIFSFDIRVVLLPLLVRAQKRVHLLLLASTKVLLLSLHNSYWNKADYTGRNSKLIAYFRDHVHVLVGGISLFS